VIKQKFCSKLPKFPYFEDIKTKLSKITNRTPPFHIQQGASPAKLTSKEYDKTFSKVPRVFSSLWPYQEFVLEINFIKI